MLASFCLFTDRLLLSKELKTKNSFAGFWLRVTGNLECAVPLLTKRIAQVFWAGSAAIDV